MSSLSVRVQLDERSYDIVVGSSCLGEVGTFARVRSRGTLACIVTDENVTTHAGTVAQALQRAGFDTLTEVLPSGEAQKSLTSANRLYDRLIDARADRRTLVVAVGGGVIGDLGGFVAATYARGLALLMVPTTLLAMVDSSVGGKVAVNHPRGKNMIGTFHQPVGVWIDIATLDTLPEREYRSGLAEVVKYGVILDPELFTRLEENVPAILAREPELVRWIVARCCRLKADIVEKDEREATGLRAILNYGHTFAHAFETAAGYSSWRHGEAVAAGMVCAARLAERRGLIGPELPARQEALLRRFHLPVRPEPWPIENLLAAMRTDKKALAGRMRLILPRRLGEVALVEDCSENDIRDILKEQTT